MASGSSKVWSSNTHAVFPVLLFFLTVITIKGVKVVSNVGENITMTCNPNRFTGNLYWSRGSGPDQYYFAAVDSNYPLGGIYTQYQDMRLSQLYEVNSTTEIRSFTFYIYDARITDSARYTCIQVGNPPYREEYDIRVLECSTCLINPRQGPNPQEVEVNCHLNDFSVSQPELINITLNGVTENMALIDSSNLTFSTSRTMIYNDIKVYFNPFGDTSSYITCTVPATLTTPSSMTVYTTSESDQSANRKMKMTILIIIVLGSTFLIILLAIIFLLRYKKTRCGDQTKPGRRTTNGSTLDKATVEASDFCYESIQGTSSMGRPGVNNVLQDSTNTIQSSSLRSSGELDSVLYTLPDKSGIINRVAIKSKLIMDEFPDIVNIPGNNKITSDNEHDRDLPRQMNPYEDVGILGSRAVDDCRMIPLYAMPEKEPGSSENAGTESLEANGAENPRYATIDKGPTRSLGSIDQAASEPKISALLTNDGEKIPVYAMPDKRPESTMKAVKATPGGNDSGEFPLYAMPDTGPGPTGNNAEAAPGGYDSGEFPLYAMPDTGPGPTANNTEAAPGPETLLLDDDGETIPLILEEGPGSPENNVEATLGQGQIKNGSDETPLYALPSKGPRSNKDQLCNVDAMYAEVV